ncbi:hypothetical protein ACH5RR_003591 [Cinchona calisaya]|uniref:PB1-like domain-containing protein n=1 Tax=Cinchona calisaya TaxID=153742 RepID=A0ABD3AVG6_9GENT
MDKQENCRDNWRLQIHMHYGGKVKRKPSLIYTGKCKKVFEPFDPDYLQVDFLRRMYRSVDEDAFNMKLFYSLPCHWLEGGVVDINRDTDVELLTSSHEGSLYIHIYVEKGEIPIQAVSTIEELLFKRVSTEGPLCLPYHSSFESLGANKGQANEVSTAEVNKGAKKKKKKKTNECRNSSKEIRQKAD